jgi:D,D-heptose 1,7-bisphosphate phosphatase
VDKDGTLVKNVPYNVDIPQIELQPGAAEGLGALQAAGYLLMIVSNQSGVALGYFSLDQLRAADTAIRRMLAERGVRLDDSYYCPHHPDGSVPAYRAHCSCRKPEPGMLLKAAAEYDIDLGASWMVGDILDDVEAGNRAGCGTLLIENGNETVWRLDRNRIPDLVAKDLREASRQIASINQLNLLRAATAFTSGESL